MIERAFSIQLDRLLARSGLQWVCPCPRQESTRKDALAQCGNCGQSLIHIFYRRHGILIKSTQINQNKTKINSRLETQVNSLHSSSFKSPCSFEIREVHSLKNTHLADTCEPLPLLLLQFPNSHVQTLVGPFKSVVGLLVVPLDFRLLIGVFIQQLLYQSSMRCELLNNLLKILSSLINLLDILQWKHVHTRTAKSSCPESALFQLLKILSLSCLFCPKDIPRGQLDDIDQPAFGADGERDLSLPDQKKAINIIADLINLIAVVEAQALDRIVKLLGLQPFQFWQELEYQLLNIPLLFHHKVLHALAELALAQNPQQAALSCHSHHRSNRLVHQQNLSKRLSLYQTSDIAKQVSTFS